METSDTKEILLVEDDPDMRDILVFWLTGEGYSVKGVGNGWEAIQTARAERFDAIVLDLLMPGVDGFQTCRYFRHDPALRDLPIVMFSAVFVDEEERRLGIEVGADEFVPKTSGFQSLIAAVNRVISKNGSGKPRPQIDEEVAAQVRREIEAACGAF